MFVYRMDRRRALSVWLFTGATNSDDDYAQYVASFAVSDEAARLAPQRGIGVLLVDEGNPVPNAAWRKRIADASTSLKSNPVVILASSSSVVRGIATAINWIRPPPYELRVASTFDEAVTIAQKERGGEPLTALRVLLDEARAEAAKVR